jgi:hypothetical protein
MRKYDKGGRWYEKGIKDGFRVHSVKAQESVFEYYYALGLGLTQVADEMAQSGDPNSLNFGYDIKSDILGPVGDGYKNYLKSAAKQGQAAGEKHRLSGKLQTLAEKNGTSQDIMFDYLVKWTMPKFKSIPLESLWNKKSSLLPTTETKTPAKLASNPQRGVRM